MSDWTTRDPASSSAREMVYHGKSCSAVELMKAWWGRQKRTSTLRPSMARMLGPSKAPVPTIETLLIGPGFCGGSGF